VISIKVNSILSKHLSTVSLESETQSYQGIKKSQRYPVDGDPWLCPITHLSWHDRPVVNTSSLTAVSSTLEPRNQTRLEEYGTDRLWSGDHVSSKQIHGLFLRLHNKFLAVHSEQGKMHQQAGYRPLIKIMGWTTRSPCCKQRNN